MELEELGLSKRVRRILGERGVTAMEGLTSLNERELLGLPGFGPGCLAEVAERLDEAGLALTDDPFAAYICARHGDRANDANLADLFLCEDCADLWRTEAFDGAKAEYEGPPIRGFCLNCNVERDDVRLRQWFLCGTCARVARSIGRSIVAERFVQEQWEATITPLGLGLVLKNTDVPTLRRRGSSSRAGKVAEIDFVARDEDTSDAVFGFELKTGKSHIDGYAQVGSRMGQFQLDTTDCDDISAVAERDDLPVYLLHVQVIDRAYPPTLRYVALGAWWTDLFTMSEHFQTVHMRSREARNAAYFDTAMFSAFETLADHLKADEHEVLAERIASEGLPDLYSV